MPIAAPGYQTHPGTRLVRMSLIDTQRNRITKDSRSRSGVDAITSVPPVVANLIDPALIGRFSEGPHKFDRPFNDAR